MGQVLEVVLFILSVIGGLLILTFLVVIHEFGHAFVARRNGVVVEEFGIGFPPRAWSKKLKNGVLLTLNWLPLGGFVKLQGENDSAAKKGDYGAANLWVKSKILLAGVTVNWLAAAVIFTGIALVGMPKILPNQFNVGSDTTEQLTPLQVTNVIKGSPAEKAGLQDKDTIVSLAGQKILSPADLMVATKAHAGKTVEIVYSRNNKQYATRVLLNTPTHAQRGYLGVASGQDTTLRSTWSAPIVGVGLTAQLSYETVKGIGTLLGQVGQGIAGKFSGDQTTKKAGDEALGQAGAGVSGPIGILFNLFPTFEKAGVVPLLLLTAIISLTLAVMNVLPIPALDGGRLYLTMLFRALKKPLTKEREEKIVGYSFYALLLLVLFISVIDIGKFFK